MPRPARRPPSRSSMAASTADRGSSRGRRPRSGAADGGTRGVWRASSELLERWAGRHSTVGPGSPVRSSDRAPGIPRARKTSTVARQVPTLTWLPARIMALPVCAAPGRPTAHADRGRHGDVDAAGGQAGRACSRPAAAMRPGRDVPSFMRAPAGRAPRAASARRHDPRRAGHPPQAGGFHSAETGGPHRGGGKPPKQPRAQGCTLARCSHHGTTGRVPTATAGHRWRGTPAPRRHRPRAPVRSIPPRPGVPDRSPGPRGAVCCRAQPVRSARSTSSAQQTPSTAASTSCSVPSATARSSA